MNKLLSTTTTLATVLAVTAITSGTALAWHPKGAINKSVQNITQNGKLSDANTTGTAVSAKPGDILNYQVTITNSATSSDGIDNSMRNTVLTDNLPAGIELVDGASKRTITDNLGTVAPGKNVVKTYKVKVTSTKDGDVIKNEACYVGDAELNDRSQKGCDVALIKVEVPCDTPAPVKETPKTPETPVETPKVETPVVEAPAELPNTGVNPIVLAGSALSAVAAYAAYMLRLRRVNA